MNDKDIVIGLKKIFGDATTPGQAFDAIMEIRRAGVTWEAAVKAVATQGRAEQVVQRQQQRLDETDDLGIETTVWQCPGCGISRSTKDYCVNPQCSEYQENAETTRILGAARAAFKNPKPTFGKYQDKTLLEIVKVNPGYIAWMVQNHTAAFWREQAKLAQLIAEVEAPPQRDTGDTGFFG